MNRRIFDGIILTVILLNPAKGLVKMTARRWIREEQGSRNLIGQAIEIGL